MPELIPAAPRTRRYPVQVRGIYDPQVQHEHETCDWTGDPYLCPVPACWWNRQGDEDA